MPLVAVIVAVWAAVAVILLVLNHYRAGHRHTWDPVAAQPAGDGILTAGTQTVVLRRCACGEMSTMVLAGRWTLNQVTSKTEVTAGE